MRESRDTVSPWSNVGVSLLWNAVFPLLLYRYARNSLGFSEIQALVLSALFPLLGTSFGLLRRRSLDLMGVITLSSILTSLAGVALGGSPSLLLIRESLFTLLMGLASALSLVWPGKPLMFYFGRYFTCGNDAAKIAGFTSDYDTYEGARVLHRRITQVWAGVFLLEFGSKCLMVWRLPVEVVLSVGPLVTNGIEVATMAWTFAYVARRTATAT